MKHLIKHPTSSNVWLCMVMGTLVVLSILACDPRVANPGDSQVSRAYALGTLVDVRLNLKRGEVIFGVESMDDTMVALVEQADKTLTFKTLGVGQTDIVIKTNRQTYTHAILIEDVSHIRMETQCGTQPNGYDDAFRMVLPGATLQTKYTLSSVNRNLWGRGHVSLPLSTEESYGTVGDVAETTLVYQVPDDAQGRWSLHADLPEDWFVVNLTTIGQEDIDGFELHRYTHSSSFVSGEPVTFVQVNTTYDLSVLPIHKGFKVCGLSPGTIRVQTATPNVCNVTLANDEFSQTLLTYDVIRVEGINKGECAIEILDDRGEVWETMRLLVA